MTSILIVEDHSYFAGALEVVLRSGLANDPAGGATPRFAHAPTIAEGLRLVSEDGPFELAVVDLMLPDGNGTEVVREIKASSPHTRVVVLSSMEDLSGALAAGADEAIPKFTPMAEVIDTLTRVAGKSRRPGDPDT